MARRAGADLKVCDAPCVAFSRENADLKVCADPDVMRNDL
jgi:hypothetical protein